MNPTIDHYNPKTRHAHIAAMVTLVATLGLLCVGGLVTSKNAGMAVPDWPNTFGYNMFLFPISGWVGNVFYEHTHRLWAAGTGFLTLYLCAVLIWSQKRIWLRWLGVLALVMVSLQGILGGLRVVLMRDEIGIFHACLAHTFFVLIGLIALFTSRWWLEIAPRISPHGVTGLWTRMVLFVSALIYVQLILGATMRHAHLGLAIHDFPLAYGQVWPATDPSRMEMINEGRFHSGEPDTTATQIYLQMAHRIGAVLVTIGVLTCVVSVAQLHRSPAILRYGSYGWLVLIILQFALGVETVLTNKAADIATAHVAFGALTLLTGVLLATAAWRIRQNPETHEHGGSHGHSRGTKPVSSHGTL